MNALMGDLRPPGDGSHVIQYQRVRKGPFYADFRRDKRLYPEVYHCLVQRDGSTQILSWSQHPSLEKAIEGAEVELSKFVEVEALKAGRQA